jgi:protein TonB
VEIKKSYRADLEHRRGWFFLIGLAVAIGLIALAMNISFNPGEEKMDEEMLEKIVQDLELKRPDENMMAYQMPEEKPEMKAKLNVVETPKTEEMTEELKKDQEKQLDGEGAKEEKEKAEPIIPPEVEDKENPLNFRVVERLPEFPGGPVEFMKWLTRNLKYPASAQQQKIEGRVVVSFIINKDGTTSDIKVTKSATPILDREALRVIRMMPKWKAGEDHGKPCRTMMAIPVVFAL